MSADRIIEKMAKLHDDGLQAVEMKRVQDPVSEIDVFRLHGAIVLKLSQLDSDGSKFMRIDMGCDGLACQVCDEESELISYASTHFTNTAESAVDAAWLTNPPGPNFAGAAMSSMDPGTILTGAGFLSEMHHQWFDSWVAVRDPTRSLKVVQEFLLDTLEKEYRLSDWNCNHFVDGLVQRLSTISGDCFVPGTGFEDASGNLLRVEDATVGSKVRTNDEGCLATVAVLKRIRSKRQKLVELSTAQGSLSLSASHPVVTRQSEPSSSGKLEPPSWEVKAAEFLRTGDYVIVGRHEVSLARVRAWSERREFFTIAFTPDVPAPTFQLPMFGVLTQGVGQPAQVGEPQIGAEDGAEQLPALLRLFAEVGDQEVREAMEIVPHTVWTD